MAETEKLLSLLRLDLAEGVEAEVVAEAILSVAVVEMAMEVEILLETEVL